MSLSADYALFRARFLDQWPDETHIVFDNAPDEETPADASWARFTMRAGAEKRMSFGKPSLYMQAGKLIFQVFVPAQSGATAAYDLADQFSAIFRDWRSADGAIRCASPEPVVATADEAWFQVNVLIPYQSRRYL